MDVVGSVERKGFDRDLTPFDAAQFLPSLSVPLVLNILYYVVSLA